MNEIDLAITGVNHLRKKYSSNKPNTIDRSLEIQKLVEALNEFQECVRYLNTRRSKGAVLTLSSEADVQDALFLMLKPWVRDLVPENPVDKVGGSYSIKDFYSKTLRIVIEAKYVRDKSHGKSITKELHDDIEMYRNHPYCDTLIFFIYDSDSFMPDRNSVVTQIETERIYGGKKLDCICIIKP